MFCQNQEEILECPVILVANKSDQQDRMVTTEQGSMFSREIGCAAFREISVRENIEEVSEIFLDTYRYWKMFSHTPKLKRSKSDSVRVNITHSEKIVEKKFLTSNSNVSDTKLLNAKKENDSFEHSPDEPFRSRAKTDGNLIMKKWKLHPNLAPSSGECKSFSPGDFFSNRRNSISMRGHKISCSTSISEDD